jgi:hypothetical protein
MFIFIFKLSIKQMCFFYLYSLFRKIILSKLQQHKFKSIVEFLSHSNGFIVQNVAKFRVEPDVQQQKQILGPKLFQLK